MSQIDEPCAELLQKVRELELLTQQPLRAGRRISSGVRMERRSWPLVLEHAIQFGRFQHEKNSGDGI